MKPRVAIIGAGWAGLTAAVELVEQADVTVFEAGRLPGGRARRILSHDLVLDNGQHLLIGAYHECLRVMQRIGIDVETVLRRLPMRWYHVGGVDFRCPSLPAPWHMALALLCARGISWCAKGQLLRALLSLKAAHWYLSSDITVASWLAQRGQDAEIIEQFWQPLVLSVMNTPLHEASMQMMAWVLRDSVGATRAHSDYLVPRVDLSTLFPLQACQWLAARGATLFFGQRIRRIEPFSHAQWKIGREVFDAVIVAVAPYHAAALLDDKKLSASIHAFRYYPICTVYLQFATSLELPYPIVGVQNGTAHWLFDREKLTGERGLVAAVISAPSFQVIESHEHLIDQVLADCLRVCPALSAPPLWARVIVEKRATFAATAGLVRPGVRLAQRGLYLAGDWVASAYYPATLEGAVKSGVAAAHALAFDFIE